ncbi:MAG: type III glutamate--ammonia ligase, partial [Pseudomonadota bacterium]
LDALRAFDKDRALKGALGESFAAAYLKLKSAEWKSFKAHLSEWEKRTTLDI